MSAVSVLLFANHAQPPRRMRLTIQSNRSRLVIHPQDYSCLRGRERRQTRRSKNKIITEDQSAEGKRQQRKITFEPAVAAVGGTSSIDMFYLLVGLVPCHPACRPLSLYFSCCSPFPHSLSRVLFLPLMLRGLDWVGDSLTSYLYVAQRTKTFTSSCCPPSPHSLGNHPRRMRGAAYSAVPHPRVTSP